MAGQDCRIRHKFRWFFLPVSFFSGRLNTFKWKFEYFRLHIIAYLYIFRLLFCTLLLSKNEILWAGNIQSSMKNKLQMSTTFSRKLFIYFWACCVVNQIHLFMVQKCTIKVCVCACINLIEKYVHQSWFVGGRKRTQNASHSMLFQSIQTASMELVLHTAITFIKCMSKCTANVH